MRALWQSYLLAVGLIFLSIGMSSCKKVSAREKATEEKIFIMGVGTEPQTLDPQHATSISEGLVLQALFEGLCAAHPTDDTLVEPGVARLWQSNEDATEWTFTLRRSARWSDGVPLSACDFVFSYHRILHPAGGSKYADMLYVLKNAQEYNQDHRGYILCGLDEDFPCSWEDIQGENWTGKEGGAEGLSAEGKGYWKKGLNRLGLEELLEIKKAPKKHFSWQKDSPDYVIDEILTHLIAHARAGFPDLWEKAKVGVEAPNERTLRLVMRGPTAYLPLLTKHFTWMPLPVHVVNKKNDLGLHNTQWAQAGKMVSNGPFTLKSWRINDSIEVVKNPQYRRADEVALEGMRFLPIVNGFTETRMYFDGKLHATNNIPSEMLAYARQKGGAEFQLADYYATTLYRFNTKKKPLNDARVRQALVLSLNQKTLVEKVVQGAGRPCTGFTPPTAAYTPPARISYDPEKARRLLAEAGYAGGKGFPKLVVLTTSREVQKTMTEAVQAQWKQELGIEVDIKSSEWASYKLAQQRGNYDIAYGSWSGDYPDPSTFLELWMGENGNNNTGWQNPRYEELILLARVESQAETRKALFYEAEEILLEACPVLPLFWSKRAYLLSQEVQGWGKLMLDSRPYTRLDVKSDIERDKQSSLATDAPSVSFLEEVGHEDVEEGVPCFRRSNF